MLWRTHAVAGASLSALAFHGDPEKMLVAAAIGGMAALVPDIDSPYSKLGAKVAPVSAAVSIVAGHRGFAHSLAGSAICCAVLAFALRFWLPAGAVYGFAVPCVFLGYLSHLLLDALNPQGVPLLWPSKRRFSLPLMQTGSFWEKIFFLPLLVLGTLTLLAGGR